MTNANLARNRIGEPFFFDLESRFVALLPAGNTGSCTPYFALTGSIRALVRPISPSRAQYGLLYALFRPHGLNTGFCTPYFALTGSIRALAPAIARWAIRLRWAAIGAGPIRRP